MSSTAAWRQAGRTLLAFAKSIKPEGRGTAVEMQISGVLVARAAALREPFFIHSARQQRTIYGKKVFGLERRRITPCCCCERCESVERLWRGPCRRRSGKGVREDGVWETRKIRGGSCIGVSLPGNFHAASAEIPIETHSICSRRRRRCSDDRIDSSRAAALAGFQKWPIQKRRPAATDGANRNKALEIAAESIAARPLSG
jgi:hypothetical protein